VSVETVNHVPNFVGGERLESSSDRTLPVTNPATGETIAEVPLSGAADVDAAVQRATEVQAGWGSMPVKERV